MIVWIAGATGLVGGELLKRLLQDARFERVIAIGRRELPLTHERLTQVRFAFDGADKLAALPAPTAVFSCLGTTIKKAGSKENFRAIDFGAVEQLATAARKKDANTFIHVSALNPNAKSLFFYSRVKAETESMVVATHFAASYALRPSIIDGDRGESRPVEHVTLAAMRVFSPLLGKYRPTKATAIAATAVRLALAPTPGDHVVEPDQIHD